MEKLDPEKLKKLERKKLIEANKAGNKGDTETRIKALRIARGAKKLREDQDKGIT